MVNVIYVAIWKDTGRIVPGAKEQYAFGDKAMLGRSIGQRYGKNAKEQYNIITIDVDRYIDFTEDAIDG